MEERRSELSCECQFLIGSYIFPEDLRDPESSTCTADLSIPVDTGRPLSSKARLRLNRSLNITRVDMHHTAQFKEMPRLTRLAALIAFRQDNAWHPQCKTIEQSWYPHALLKWVTLANTIAAKGRASPSNNCAISSEPRCL